MKIYYSNYRYARITLRIRMMLMYGCKRGMHENVANCIGVMRMLNFFVLYMPAKK